MMNRRNYRKLLSLPTFNERFEYLKLNNAVGEQTFGDERYLNQSFYHSTEWRRIRDQVITRDMGCDLGIQDREILGDIIIHHMNPITVDEIDDLDLILNPDYLICVSRMTHNAIHYGDINQIIQTPLERTPGDTCPWR